MTVSVQTPFTAATANGVTTVFPYAFRIIDQADLDVTLDGVLQTTGFTVSGIGDDIGGNVTFDVAPDAGVYVLLARDPVLERDTDYAQFGKLPASVLNTDIDRVWLALQKFANDFTRSLKLPVDTLTDQLINATPGERANALVTFDGSGNLTITPMTSIAVNVSAGSFTVDTFDGTGAQTAFTLSRDPGILNNTSVFVGGAYIRKDQYSISGTTLTFDVAPASGTDNIEVCQSVALEAGSPADGTVTVNSLSNGALPATVQGRAKMGDGFVTLAKISGSDIGTSLGQIPLNGTSKSASKTMAGVNFDLPQLQPLGAAISGGKLVITLGETTLDFRAGNLLDGTINRAQITTPLTLEVSNGSTLGMVNGVAATLVVIATEYYGAVQLGIVNIAGGVSLDETYLISTTAEGGIGAADSDSVIYTTTAQTNVPFRVVGYIDITQATAGSWVSSPTKVQGAGGQAIYGITALGSNQTWVAAGKVSGTVYQNNTGRPIQLAVTIILSVATSPTPTATLQVDTVNPPTTVVALTSQSNNTGSDGTRETFYAIVPPGHYYRVVLSSCSIGTWNELR